MRVTKDDIVTSLTKYWLTEIEVKPRTHSKRLFRTSITKIFGVKKEYIIIKYFSYGIIPRLVKIKINDILSLRSKIRRRKPINNINFLRITTLKKCKERKVLVKKTIFFKWSIIFSTLLIIIGLSVGVALII